VHHAVGVQAAQMADQIRKGARPADLPVQTAEFYLSINLKAANTVGVSIPDTILRQANTVIR
jgi:putative ABC transport system substrate-binding protein